MPTSLEMKFLIRPLFIFLFLGVALTFDAAANCKTTKDSNGDTSQVSCAHESTVPVEKLDSHSIRKIVEEAHDAIEGHTQSKQTHATDNGFGKAKNLLVQHAKEFSQKLDFKNTAFNAIRWANQNKTSPKYRDHILNLSFLLPVSHTVEFIWAPIFILLNPGLSPEQQGAIFTTGMGTAAGDVLCWTLYAIYPVPGVSKAVTQVRVAVTSVVQKLPGASRNFGFQSAWDQTKKELFFELNNQSGTWSSTFSQNNETLTVYVDVNVNDESLVVASFSGFEMSRGFKPSQLPSNIRKHLGPNLMQILRRFSKQAQANQPMSDAFFIQELVQEDVISVKLNPQAFPLRSVWSCDLLFAKK